MYHFDTRSPRHRRAFGYGLFILKEVSYFVKEDNQNN